MCQFDEVFFKHLLIDSCYYGKLTLVNCIHPVFFPDEGGEPARYMYGSNCLKDTSMPEEDGKT